MATGPKGKRPARFIPTTEAVANVAVNESTIQLAEQFAAIAEMLDLAPRSEMTALLLSTCRNHFMTLNAVFVDLRLALSHGDLSSPMSRAAKALERGEIDSLSKILNSELGPRLRSAVMKFDVWDQRTELHKELTDARTRMRMSRKASAELVLAEVDLSDGAAGTLYDTRYLKISEREYPELAERDSLLRDCVHGMNACLTLLSTIRVHGIGDAKLFEEDLSKFRDDMERVVDVVRTDPILWGCRLDGNAVYFAESDLVIDPSSSEWSVLPPLRRAVARRLTELTEGWIQKLRTFEPNSSRKPLPPLYEIDLRSARLDQTRQSGEFELLTHDMDARPAGNVGRIGLIECGVPESWYSLGAHPGVFQYNSPESIDLHTVFASAVDAAFEAAAAEGVHLLVFPEYFLPRACRDTVKSAVERSGIACIVGLEQGADHGRVCDEVLVAFPGKHAETLRKQRPSKHEQRTFSGGRGLHVFLNTALGTLAVFVCSDYREWDIVASVVKQLNAPLDVIVVCSMNDRQDVYVPQAQADASRLYCYVAVANALCLNESSGVERGGSFVVGPTRSLSQADLQDVLIDIPDWERGAPVLRIAELDFEGLMSRTRDMPKSGFLAPSHFARVD